MELSATPARVYGHARTTLSTTEANLVEGRELNGPASVAVDTSSSPAITYVSDTGNNRILVWKDAKSASSQFADKVIGQNDLYTTFAGGPGTSNTVGFRSPSGIAVDASGNLFVADTGNNRILRFPKPLSQTSDLIQPDLIFGQTNLSSNTANQGLSNPTAKTLAFVRGGSAYRIAMYFDPSGNLWVTDAGNHRVLRFPAAAVSGSQGNDPAADLVIGQADFATSTQFNNDTLGPLYKSGLIYPSSITLDQAGRLFVGDVLGRVLVYAPPFTNGVAAKRVLGVVVNVSGQPALPAVNQYSLHSPDGIFTISNNIFVVDSLVHRITRYDPYDTWAEETTTVPSPAAKAVYGQSDLLGYKANSGGKTPNAATFNRPSGSQVVGSDLYLADSGNNRLLIMPAAALNISAASIVQGQLSFFYGARNLIEGRELYTVTGLTSLPSFSGSGGSSTLSGGVVVDKTSSPPRLYIADTGNHRILCFKDARAVKPGDIADLIIGQVDRFSSVINSPANDADALSDTGLYNPVGVAVDSAGNLWVSDTGNGRVLRFPKPFEQPTDRPRSANLVLGQIGFNFKVTDASRNNMSAPYGIAFTSDGSVAVSDAAHNRVLLFKKPATGDFTNGQAAATVFGQRDFTSRVFEAGDNRFNTPGHIATDTDDRLYVCDTGKNRVAIFSQVNLAANDPAPTLALSQINSGGDRLTNPQGIFVSTLSGEIWVADTQNNRAVRFPKFDSLLLSPLSNYQLNSVIMPIALTNDAYDNLIIADGANRIAFYYPRLVTLSAAHYLERPISPSLIATLGPVGVRFTEQSATFSSLPMPKELADIEVLVNGVAAPLFYVGPTQINYQVPKATPTSGTVDIVVQKKSIGQILASSTVSVASATPGFFTATQNGTGQISALNEDNTVNSSSNAAGRGTVVQLYGTGYGYIENGPADGEGAQGAINAPRATRVIVNTAELAQSDILYSGLAPGFVGLWQLNIRIPMSVPPSNSVIVVALYDNVPSNSNASGRIIQTTIAVK